MKFILKNMGSALTSEQKELLTKFQELESKKKNKSESFFDKIKKTFKK